MFAALGTKVTVVEQRDRMLEFCDVEVVEALKYHCVISRSPSDLETVSSVQARPTGRSRRWRAEEDSRDTVCIGGAGMTTTSSSTRPG